MLQHILFFREIPLKAPEAYIVGRYSEKHYRNTGNDKSLQAGNNVNATSTRKICAVISTYNRRELLRRLLIALLTQTATLDEIIVVDGPSIDGTPAMIEKEFPMVTYIRLTIDTGGAGQFYAGMKVAYVRGCDWIWVMDDDALPLPDALEQLLKVLKDIEDKKVYALSSAVITLSRNTFETFRYFDPVRLKVKSADIEKYKLRYFECDLTSFVGTLFSRQAIEKYGLPLKDLFIYYDDWEYSLRIRRGSGKILVIPASKIIHLSKQSSVRRSLTHKDYYDIRNSIYLKKMYGRNPGLLFVSTLYFALKKQAEIILYRQNKLLSSKILWRGIIDGLIGKLGKLKLY